MSRLIKDYGYLVRVRKYHFVYWRNASARVRQGWNRRFLSLHLSEGILFICTFAWTHLGHDDVTKLLEEVSRYLEESKRDSRGSGKFKKLFGKGGRRSLRLVLDRSQALRFKDVLEDAVDVLAPL